MLRTNFSSRQSEFWPDRSSTRHQSGRGFSWQNIGTQTGPEPTYILPCLVEKQNPDFHNNLRPSLPVCPEDGFSHNHASVWPDFEFLLSSLKYWAVCETEVMPSSSLVVVSALPGQEQTVHKVFPLSGLWTTPHTDLLFFSVLLCVCVRPVGTDYYHRMCYIGTVCPVLLGCSSRTSHSFSASLFQPRGHKSEMSFTLVVVFLNWQQHYN